MPQTVPWKLRAGEETGLVTAKVISGTSLRVVQWPSPALAHAPGLLMPSPDGAKARTEDDCEALKPFWRISAVELFISFRYVHVCLECNRRLPHPRLSFLGGEELLL